MQLSIILRSTNGSRFRFITKVLQSLLQNTRAAGIMARVLLREGMIDMRDEAMKDLHNDVALRRMANKIRSAAEHMKFYRLVIDLIQNRITYLSLCDMPEEDIAVFPRLVVPFLSVNNSLTKLELDNNYLGDECISHLFYALQRHSGFTSISLKNNYITADNVFHGQRILGALPVLAAVLRSSNTAFPRDLRELRLSNNAIGDQGAELMVEILPHLEKLTVLELNGCNISHRGIVAITQALRHNRFLCELDIGDNHFFAARSAHEVARTLKFIPSLQKLVFSGHYIGEAGARILANALRGNGNLRELNLSGGREQNTNVSLFGQPQPVTGIGNEGASALAEVLVDNQTLEKLNVSSNEIGVAGILALAQVVGKCYNLRLFDCSHNDIELRGMSVLAEALKGNRHLQKLILTDCAIDDSAIGVLVKALRHNCTIAQLKLDDNLFGAAGMAAIIRVLLENTHSKIAYLDLSQSCSSPMFVPVSGVSGNTQLDSAAAISGEVRGMIKQLLQSSRTLTHLYLGNIRIGDEGAQLVAEGLRENTTLEYLNIEGAVIGDVGAIAIAEALYVNHTLQYLGFDDNDISIEGYRAIESALRVNHTILDIGMELEVENIEADSADEVERMQLTLEINRHLKNNRSRLRAGAQLDEHVNTIEEVTARIRMERRDNVEGSSRLQP